MVKGQVNTMAESFINQVKRTSSIKTYEYDYRLDAINTWNRRIKENG